MSLLVVAAAVLVYLIIVVFVLALLVSAKRADEVAEREHRARMRSTSSARAPQGPATEDDPGGEIAARRLVG
jgi:hypothetical protein